MARRERVSVEVWTCGGSLDVSMSLVEVSWVWDQGLRGSHGRYARAPRCREVGGTAQGVRDVARWLWGCGEQERAGGGGCPHRGLD